MRPHDTELAELFRQARNVLNYRQVGEMTGVHYETWRRVERRMIFQVSPAILEAATSTPWAPPYEQYVAALERDLKRIFDINYRNRPAQEEASRLTADGPVSGTPTASIS